MLTKQRVTVPYTATIIAKFSAQLDGFLRWGGGYNGRSRNFHYQYRGRRATLKYRFGNARKPFYQVRNTKKVEMLIHKTRLIVLSGKKIEAKPKIKRHELGFFILLISKV